MYDVCIYVYTISRFVRISPPLSTLTIYFIVGIAQGLMDIGPTTPFNMRRAADKFLFGLLFLNNGVLSLLSKMGIIKKRDVIDPDADPPIRIGF